MKAIAFERTCGMPIAEPPSLTLIPDSALVLNGNPLFLPDFSARWTAAFYIMFRICRLGKAIPQKFASRYYDAVGVALRAIPTDTTDELRATGRECGLLGAFDNCLVPGQWLPVPDDRNLTVSVGGVTADMSAALADIDRVLEMLGRYTTLKMGDIVMPCRLPIELPMSAEDRFEAKVNGSHALLARIK